MLVVGRRSGEGRGAVTSTTAAAPRFLASERAKYRRMPRRPGAVSGPPEEARGIMAKAKDPICGMMVDPERAAAKSERDGQVVYFCSVACKTKFDSSRGR